MVTEAAKEMEEALKKTREVLENIFRTGHGELTMKIADGRMVDFNYEARWHLRKTE